MEREELNNSKQHELMERIKAQYAEDLKTSIGCGTIFLVILVMNIFSFAIDNDIVWSDVLKNCSVPLVIVLWSIIEVWWKKRMNKCTDAEELVSMHKKYTKYRKAEYIVALMLMVILTYPLYLKYAATTDPEWLSISVWGAWVVLFCLLLWRLFKKPKKSPIDQDIELLQELIGNG